MKTIRYDVVMDSDYTLEDDTTILSGVWVRVNFVNPNNAYTLTLKRGRFRELSFNGVPFDSEDALPGWVVVDGAYLNPLLKEPRYEEDPLVVAVYKSMHDRGPLDLIASWERGVDIVHELGPGCSYNSWRQKHIEWSEGVKNPVYSKIAFERMAAFLLKKSMNEVTLGDWDTVRDILLSKPANVWKGRIVEKA
ncbi:MAG: hypothetical protein KatS3mg015_2772 [Fimbriimonadales bacterium]|nr:MAG: hypothetical protein KatS3mg015_2772 [Fimbriimonadales bacterium]